MTQSPLFKEVSNLTIERLGQIAFGPRTSLVSAEPLFGGDFNTTYKLVLADRPAPVILRIAPEGSHRLYSFERSLMIREWRINKLLRSEGTRVPEALYFGAATSWLNRDHSFWEFLPGRTLEGAEPSSAQLATLHSQIKPEIEKMNRISSGWFGWAGQAASRHSTWPDFLLSIVAEVADRNEDQPVLPPASIRRTIAILQSAKAAPGNGSMPVLLHNNLHPGNVMVDDDFNLAGIIDADRCLYGPVEVEVGVSELAQDINSADWVDPSGAASLASKVYKVVLNMFDADVCKTQLRRDDTSDFLVDCVQNDLKSLEGR